MNEPIVPDPILDQISIEPCDVIPTLTKMASETYQNLLEDPVIQKDIETSDPEEFASFIFGSVQINYAHFNVPQFNSPIDPEPQIVNEVQTK